MRRIIIILAAAVGAFFVWQWFLSKRDPGKAALDKQRSEADKAGKAQERLQMAGRPRLADDYSLKFLPAILAGSNALWSQILPDGRVNNSTEKEYVDPERDPSIYGYG